MYIDVYNNTQKTPCISKRYVGFFACMHGILIDGAPLIRERPIIKRVFYSITLP